MAGSINKVILLGRLGADPEIRVSQDGNKIARFSVATSETWKDKNTNEKKDRTEWHRAVLYGKMAETASQYKTKGSMVYVEGRLRTREWEDQNQNKRKTTEIMCDNFTMLGRRGESNQSQNSSPDISAEDDDLPF